MAKHGPIESPMESIPGDPSNIRGDSANEFNGVPNLGPKGDMGDLPYVTLVKEGEFSSPKPAGKGE